MGIRNCRPTDTYLLIGFDDCLRGGSFFTLPTRRLARQSQIVQGNLYVPRSKPTISFRGQLGLLTYGSLLQSEGLSSHGSHKDWKTWKNETTFSSRGKVREFYPKYWKSQGILGIFYVNLSSDFLIEVYLLDRSLYLLNSLNKTLKKYWKMEEKY